MKKIKKKIKSKDKYHFPSVYFGFLSAFAMIITFFMFKAITEVVISSFYARIIALIIYALLFYSSHYYSQYDKDLRKSLIASSIVLWITYFIAITFIYLI